MKAATGAAATRVGVMIPDAIGESWGRGGCLLLWLRVSTLLRASLSPFHSSCDAGNGGCDGGCDYDAECDWDEGCDYDEDCDCTGDGCCDGAGCDNDGCDGSGCDEDGCDNNGCDR